MQGPSVKPNNSDLKNKTKYTDKMYEWVDLWFLLLDSPPPPHTFFFFLAHYNVLNFWFIWFYFILFFFFNLLEAFMFK